MGKGVDHKRSHVFARHRGHRARGVPTLSVLVGDVDIAQWCWTGWQRAESSTFVCSNAPSGDAVLRDWLSSGVLRGALLDTLVKRSAAEGRVTSENIAAHLCSLPEGQRQRAGEQLSERLGWSAALIGAIVSVDAGALISWAISGAPRSLVEIDAARPALPGLLALPPRSTSSGDLSSLFSMLLNITESVPRLELACALSEAQFVRWRQEADARELRRVAEGLVGVEPVVREPEPDASARRSSSSQRRGAHRRDAASTAVPRLEYDAEDFIRSCAERRRAE